MPVTNAASGPIRVIAFAPWAGTPSAPAAAPSGTLVALGGTLDWAGTAVSGTWATTVGGTAEDAHLDTDSIAIKLVEKTVEIAPPLAQAPQDVIILQNHIGAVSFAVYSHGTNEDNLTSSAGTPSGTSTIVEEGLSWTRRSMCIEVTGKGLLYFPHVRVKRTDLSGAADKPVGSKYEVQVLGYDSGTAATSVLSGMRSIRWSGT